MVRILVTAAAVMALSSACDLAASAKDYARRVCAQRCGAAGQACQLRCERGEAPWKVWLVRIEPRGAPTAAAQVNVETRDGPTGALEHERLLSDGNTAWPATTDELRLSRFDDGRGVALLGYVVDGASTVVVQAPALRLGQLTASGVDWVATLPSPRTNIGAIGSAAGDSYWVGGPPSYGIQEVRRGGASPNATLPLGNEFVRALAVRGGTLFAATGVGLRTIPLPLGSAPAKLEVEASSLSDFELVDLEDETPGLDTLYLTHGSQRPGLSKHRLRQGTWALEWDASSALTVDDPINCHGLAVLPRKPAAVILCVRSGAVVRFDDDPVVLDGGAPIPTLFATTTLPSEFRGIAIVPEQP
jgi:hypothetical protein